MASATDIRTFGHAIRCTSVSEEEPTGTVEWRSDAGPDMTPDRRRENEGHHSDGHIANGSGPTPLIGRHVGAFEVKELLGVGGMGEVYRALDTRLGRDVAIKVLPAAFKNDQSRVVRFQREATVLASLNHSNIASIYGIEETADVTGLVMELVDGHDLSRRGRAKVAEAIDIARQIVQALEAAHERGIVHRDLKPANIKVRPDGTVKVLDFGLATALGTPGGLDSTLTAHTHPGTVLGTPAYMSPEQARGEPVGPDADIWAFGVLLYELLTGIPLFARPTIAETFARVLGESPDYSRLPHDTPANVRVLIRRCLEKDRKRRLQHIGDARLELDDSSSERTVAPLPTPVGRRWRAALLAAGALALGLVGVTAGAVWSRMRGAPALDPVYLTTMLPVDVSVTRAPLGASVALSPDGRMLVIAGTDKAGPRLYSRPFNRLDASPIAGTERASSPFFSPDGQWIGFFADGRLKRISATGGAAVDIVAISGALRQARWGSDGRILFSYGADGTVYLVNAAGGSAEAVAGVNGYYPDLTPDGRTLVFEADGWIHLRDLPTGRQSRLVEGASPRLAAGHLVLARGSTLLAAPIDLASQTLAGPVVPVVQGVAADSGPSGGTRHYAISTTGTLAYVPAAGAYALILVRPDGTTQQVTEEQRSFGNPQFSPDGRRLAVAQHRHGDQRSDIWIHDLANGAATRLTSDGGRAPIWTPDGTSITYSRLGTGSGIYVRRADGRDEPRQLVALEAFHWLVGWTPDQKTLAYGQMEGSGNESSILAHRDGVSRHVVGPSSTWGGRLSPDGRLLVYYSLDPGNFEIYVTPFPAGGDRWLIGDGIDPIWSPDGREVYFRSGTRLMAARVETTAGVHAVSRRVVVEPFLPPSYDDYAIHPDGRTLVITRPVGATQVREVNVIVNWHQELTRLMTAR